MPRSESKQTSPTRSLIVKIPTSYISTNDVDMPTMDLDSIVNLRGQPVLPVTWSLAAVVAMGLWMSIGAYCAQVFMINGLTLENLILAFLYIWVYFYVFYICVRCFVDPDYRNPLRWLPKVHLLYAIIVARFARLRSFRKGPELQRFKHFPDLPPELRHMICMLNSPQFLFAARNHCLCVSSCHLYANKDVIARSHRDFTVQVALVNTCTD